MANYQEQHNDMVVKMLTIDPDLIKNKMWRMGNLYWIITKDKKKEVFQMNRAQKHFADNYLLIKNPYYRHIILKSRQLGFTTLIDLWILDEILFNPNIEGLIIAHKLADATEIFDRKIDFAVKNMAEDVRDAFFKIQRNSSKKIQVVTEYGQNKGSMSSVSVSVSGRSGTFHLLHISEFAPLCIQFPKRAEEVITGTFPAVPMDGFIFIESTAETMADKFYEMFQKSWMTRDKISPQLSRVMFVPHFYNWQYDDMELKKITECIPVKDMMVAQIDWGEYQKEHKLSDKEITYYYMKYLQLEGDIHKLMQQYPTTVEEAFLASGQTYFPMTKVASMMETAEKGKVGELILDEKAELKFQETSMGRLEIFSMPEQGTRYVVGGDTAEGLAHGDAQVLYVINHKTEECAAIYHSQVPPDEMARDAYDLGKFYNWAILGIEANKDGLWVNDAIEKMGYVNLYARKVFDDRTQKITNYFGWKTTSATRPFGLAALKAVFLRKSKGFPRKILEEMVSFIRNEKGRAEAISGKHDDCVMAASIGYAILQEQGKFIEESGKNEKISVMKMIFNEQN